VQRLLFSIPWLLILACATTPDFAPGTRMAKIVHRNVSPGVEADSVAAQPHTLFRAGQRFGRMEYPPNPDEGTHLVVIVREPQVWLVDHERMTVVESRDPGPSYVFRAPVLGAKGEPIPLFNLEFGKEFDFLEANGAEPTQAVTADGAKADRYEAVFEDLTVVLIASPGSRIARELQVFKGGELYRAFHYDSYELDLDPVDGLFRPPQ
jgi:hypothetical protein